MAKKDIFMSDIEIPENVQKKADTVFLSIQKEGFRTMKKKEHTKAGIWIRSLAAVAACAIVLVGIYTAINGVNTQNSDPISVSDEGTNSVVESINHVFSMKVMAAELEKGNAVPAIKNNNGQAYSLGGSNGEVSYCIDMPLSCEGENVESITYSLNQGAFKIINPEENNIYSDQVPYDGTLNTGTIGGANPDGGTYSIGLFQSYTVAYDKQTEDYSNVNVCNVLTMSDEDYGHIFNSDSVEEKTEAMAKLFDGTVISCTIHYTDGTSEVVNITMGAKVMTYAELGDTSPKADMETTVITFELQ